MSLGTIDIRKLRYSVALARHLSFTKASRELNLTQSALSRSIQSLEEDCRLRLFDRNRNAVTLTPVGREFIAHAHMLLRKEQELIDMVNHSAQGQGGSISLGMAPLASRTLLAPLMTEMIGQPGFRASVRTGDPKSLMPLLLDETLHVAVCTGRTPFAHPLFVSVPLARFPISLIVRAGHPLTELAGFGASDMERYPLLHTRSLDADSDETTPMGDGINQAPALAVEDYDILAQIVSASDAVWITSPITAKDRLAEGSLTELAIDWLAHKPEGYMTAFHLKGRTLAPTAQHVLGRLAALARTVFGKAGSTPRGSN